MPSAIRVLTACVLLAVSGMTGWWLGHSSRTINTETPALTSSAAAFPMPQAPPLALQNTHVHSVPNTVTGRRYEVWVDLPPSYFENDKPYPVVFITDADYGFPLIRSLRRRVGAKGRNIEDFILVGLSYAVGEQSMPSKRRDYTPTDPFTRSGHALSGDSYDRDSTYGQAAAYRDYLERDVFALVAKHYRVDIQRKIYIGHSLGGLFGSYVLLTKPTMFSHYVLGSPSLWFDRHRIFDFESNYADAHRDLPANVMFCIGSYETIGEGPRYFDTTDMVGDMRTFDRRLRARKYPGLQVNTIVLPEQDHLTVFPEMATRALLWALPGSGPYTSG